VSTGTEAKERPSRRQTPKLLGRVRIGAVVALAAATGFVAWLIIRDSDDSTPTTQVTSPAPSPPVTSTVTGISEQGLRTLAASLDRPIYWAGRRRGDKFSLRRTSDGRFFVRYLPAGVRVGDPRPNFLVVATYPMENAFAATRNAARGSGGNTRRIAGGGIVYYADDSPTNVYIAYPGKDYQIEVFHPNPTLALRLVTSGRVEEIR
jgi:hypothetical protein